MVKKSDRLEKYRAKRDFHKTSEPGGILASTKGNSFLIQKHAASHLHYDFRLELDGVLKSWAVPKGPNADPAVKRLAMAVEDHPVAYGSFEGVIPKGEYGGGTVMLWDQGAWEPIGDPRAGIAKGKLIFKVYGQRIKGEWTLVKTHGRLDAKGNSWLLIKHHDDEERPDNNDALVNDNLTSVVSGRTMEEIAQQKNSVWKSNKEVKTKSLWSARGPTDRKKLIPTGKATKELPGFIEPQLATLSDAVPKGDKWIHEIKFDGYRMLAYVENGDVRMISRNDKDWTGAFGSLTKNIAALPVTNAIFDGEIVALDKNNKSNFSDLKTALGAADYSNMQYYIFDLLFLNDTDLRKKPLRERRASLKNIIAKIPAKHKNRVLFSEEFNDDDGNFFQGVCSMHLEGIISKRADGIYSSGRSKSWLKIKCIKREEFVIGGFVKPTNGSKGIGSLLLGYYEEGQLIYAGRVGTGWNNELSVSLRKMLDRLVILQSEYKTVPTEGRRGAIWVKPKMVCEIEFSDWTPDGHLRHPSFEGLREDKPAKDVRRDEAEPLPQAEKEAEQEVKKHSPKLSAFAAKAKAVKSSAKKSEILVGGIKISHPDRIVYPDSNITKLQLAEYYYGVADHILPYVINRPLSMLRCPEGIGSECFFQRHVGLGKAPSIHEVNVTVKGESREYVMIQDIEGLISLAQWGVIELHPWQCSADDVRKADQIIFDLDPDPGVSWKTLIEGAHEIKKRMGELGLKTFLKTTGGKGLHVVVPHSPVYSFPTIKAFAKAIAESMAQDNPKKYIAQMSKEARRGKIFVDYLRNDVTSTAAAAYSARARPGATVSMPINWTDLTAKLNPADLTIETVLTLLMKQKTDPWKDFFKTKQKINPKYLKALNIDY
jgi:bifunctional non-homologous end joining protein LigD